MQSLEEIKKIPFVFIVAKGRSGTTLMQNMLDANPNVMLPIESRLIIHLKHKYFPVVKWNEQMVENLLTDLYKDNKFDRYWNIKKEDLRKSIHQYDISQLTFSSICKIIYLSYPSPFEKTTIKLIGDKNPIYSIFVAELQEVFPEAKFIHLLRDYRDNIVSNRQVFSRKGISILAQGWIAHNLRIDKSKAVQPEKFYTLRYEDLVAEPMKYVPELCEFLKIDFNPDMLSFHKTLGEVKDQKYVKEIKIIHPNIINPINSTQVNKWEKNLLKSEIELIDYIDGAYGKQHGYIQTTHKKNMSLAIRSAVAHVRANFDFFVIKTYYKMPFALRDGIGGVSKKLFQWFKFTTFYNHDDFRFKD